MGDDCSNELSLPCQLLLDSACKQCFRSLAGWSRVPCHDQRETQTHCNNFLQWQELKRHFRDSNVQLPPSARQRCQITKSSTSIVKSQPEYHCTTAPGNCTRENPVALWS